MFRILRWTRYVPWINQQAKYQNFVNSDALAHLDKECERYCAVPRIPPQKLTIIGGGTDVGTIAALFLKQQKVVKVLALYDDVPERGVVGKANDLAHIDTSPQIEVYQGRTYLRAALHNADVVLICGGNFPVPPCCNVPDRELFLRNMAYVRTAAVACTAFCPKAIICVQTPPVDCNFALVAYTFKVARVFDKRRILGVNSINAMRANQLFCSITGQDPSKGHLPVVCGTGRCTRVPVFSAIKAGNFPQNQAACLTRLVREADEIICKVKSDSTQGHLSIGFATARMVLNVMTGLFQKSSFVDSALVEQKDPEKCWKMKMCATPVTIGKGGIVEYAIPTLNDTESKLFEQSRCDLQDMLNLGRCYAVGEEYHLDPCKYPTCQTHKPCPVCKPCGKKKEKD